MLYEVKLSKSLAIYEVEASCPEEACVIARGLYERLAAVDIKVYPVENNTDNDDKQ